LLLCHMTYGYNTPP